jgi:FtsZ-binding cell division protein ZapB
MTKEAPVTTGNAPQDQSKAFLHRLVTSIRMGHRLDDPRNVEVLQRWAAICKGLPDNALLEVIPKTLRGLLRQPELSAALTGPCGISAGHPMQHESIAPYIISYRRYQKSRGVDPKDEKARRAIDGLRCELRALREQFNTVFDQLAGLEQERERLSGENESLQQQVLAERLRGDEAERRLQEARDKAFRLFRLYLFMLKEERSRLSNDPNRERLLTAEISVETHAATLEALGYDAEADAQARDILGDSLFEEYFHGVPSGADPLASRAPSAQALDLAQGGQPQTGPDDQLRGGSVHVLHPRQSQSS